jgi:uncharacterized protein YjhX (UPF0386 family)
MPRTRYLFDPKATKPYTISRSGLEQIRTTQPRVAKIEVAAAVRS